MSERQLVVVSGLPGSGETTVGGALSRGLSLPSSKAVLVNWWNHDTSPRRLQEVADSLVEVFCDCPLDIAVGRFTARERHPGHLDRLRTAEEHEEGIRVLRDSYRGPLSGGPLITVDTSRPVDVEALLGDVRAALSA